LVEPPAARKRDIRITAQFLQLRQKIAKGPPGVKVDVRERAGVDHEIAHMRRRRGDQLARLVCEAVDVGVEQIGAEAIDDQARSGLQAGPRYRRLPKTRGVGREQGDIRAIGMPHVALIKLTGEDAYRSATPTTCPNLSIIKVAQLGDRRRHRASPHSRLTASIGKLKAIAPIVSGDSDDRSTH
jgi:hypothetical protein